MPISFQIQTLCQARKSSHGRNSYLDHLSRRFTAFCDKSLQAFRLFSAGISGEELSGRREPEQNRQVLAVREFGNARNDYSYWVLGDAAHRTPVSPISTNAQNRRLNAAADILLESRGGKWDIDLSTRSHRIKDVWGGRTAFKQSRHVGSSEGARGIRFEHARGGSPSGSVRRRQKTRSLICLRPNAKNVSVF
jgi:hypothetical protein